MKSSKEIIGPADSSSSEFDQYATNYESALQQGLSVSGESADYFARGRVQWLKRVLQQESSLGLTNSQVPHIRAMDFGCGTGNSVAHLMDTLGANHVLGIDTSEQSLVQARTRYNADQTTFLKSSDYQPNGSIDLVYCNGVFHHIPLEVRADVVQYIWKSLAPGGLFAFWENNPWNPGTQWVMYRIPFDRDAIKLSITGAKKLLVAGGFEIRRIDSCFYFPRWLGWLRVLEPSLSKLPFGAQYLILARKNDST